MLAAKKKAERDAKKSVKGVEDAPGSEPGAGGEAEGDAPLPGTEGAACTVLGLADLLCGCNLADKLEAAAAWCAEQAVESTADIKESKLEDEFAAALQLKPAKAKILVAKLRAAE